MKAAAHRDPVTGDSLTGGEWVSWRIQSVIRRWHFLVSITIITILIWTTNNPIALLWWNLAASFLALVIESIVGIAMFSQTRRDALVLREVRALTEKMNALLQQEEHEIETIEEHLEGQSA